MVKMHIFRPNLPLNVFSYCGDFSGNVVSGQSPFWMATSCCKAHKRIFMKLVDFDQNLKKSQNFENFHFEKVRFPEPKSYSNCFIHLQKEVSFAPGSWEIVLDTYKVHFGRVEVAVTLKSEFL